MDNWKLIIYLAYRNNINTMAKSIQNFSYRVARYFHLVPFVFVTITGLPGRIKISTLKKSIILTTILLSALFSYGQTKNQAPKPEYDTVILSYDRLIALDSLTYNALLNLVGSIPANLSKSAGAILNAIDGSNKNVFLRPQYGLKPKQKK